MGFGRICQDLERWFSQYFQSSRRIWRAFFQTGLTRVDGVLYHARKIANKLIPERPRCLFEACKIMKKPRVVDLGTVSVVEKSQLVYNYFPCA